MNASQPENAEYVLPLDDVDRAALPIAGGKAANLGELIRAGLPVPPGFCVTTAAYELVAEGADLDPTLDALTKTPTERITTGQQITVDGSAGTIAPQPRSDP